MDNISRNRYDYCHRRAPFKPVGNNSGERRAKGVKAYNIIILRRGIPL